MSIAISADTNEGEFQSPAAITGDEALVEKIWQEVQGMVAREQIQQLVIEAKNDFADATVTIYLPILVHRQVKEKLAEMLDDAETAALWRGVNPTPLEQVGGSSDWATTTGINGHRFTIWPFRLFSGRRDREQEGNQDRGHVTQRATQWLRHI